MANLTASQVTARIKESLLGARFTEALLLPLLNRMLELAMPSVKQRNMLAFKFHDLKSKLVPEYYECPDSNSLLQIWEQSCGSMWVHITQILGIPPGEGWYEVEWDINKQAIKYTLHPGIHHKTESVEDTAPPPPPPVLDYLITSRSPEGKLIERLQSGADLADLIRVQQELRSDHVIIEITLKGEA